MTTLPPPPPPPPVPPMLLSPPPLPDLLLNSVKTTAHGDDRSQLLNDIRNGIKLKKCETIEKNLLNKNCQNTSSPQSNGDTNNNLLDKIPKDPRMALVQAELTNTLKKRKDGTLYDDPKTCEKQILSPTLANFVRNKTQPLKRDETKEENSPKFISHGKRNFTLERKTQNRPKPQSVEESIGENNTTNNIEEKNEKTPKIEKVEFLKTLEAPVKCSSVSSLDSSSLLENTNDSGFTSHSEDSSLNPSPTPMLSEENDMKSIESYELPTTPSPITVTTNVSKKIEMEEKLPATPPPPQPTSTPIVSKKVDAEVNSAQQPSIAKQISLIEQINISEANKKVQKFTRQWSKTDTVPRKSEKLLISHGKPNFKVTKQSRPEFVREKMANGYKTPTTPSTPSTPTSPKPPALLSPEVQDELKICSGTVQEMRKNYNKENEENAQPIIIHKSEVKIFPHKQKKENNVTELTRQKSPINHVSVTHDEVESQIQTTVVQSPLQNGHKVEDNIEPVKNIFSQQGNKNTETELTRQINQLKHVSVTHDEVPESQIQTSAVQSPVQNGHKVEEQQDNKSRETEVTRQISQLKHVPINHDENEQQNQTPVIQNGGECKQNTDSVKMVQISRFMSSSDFKPAKSESGHVPFVPVSADLADKHNFEKKTAISFAKDLSVQPNRYPDTAVVSKPNPVSENDRNLFSNLKVDDLLLQNIQFSIDPERNDITIDLKIGVNLRQKLGIALEK